MKLKVLSVIRFKPKVGRMEEVIDELKAHNEKCRKKFGQQRFLSQIDEELYLVKISPSIDEIRDDQDISLAHLDTIRHLLEAWSIEEGHTRATSGMLIDE